MHYSVDPNSSSFHACFGDPDDPDNLLKRPFAKFSRANCELRLTGEGRLGIFATAHISQDEKLFDELPVIANTKNLTMQNARLLRSVFEGLPTIHRLQVATLPRTAFRYNQLCDEIDLEKRAMDKVNEKDAKVDKLGKEIDKAKLADEGTSKARRNRKGKGKKAKANKGKAIADDTAPDNAELEGSGAKGPKAEGAKNDDDASDPPETPDWRPLARWDAVLYTILETNAIEQGLYPNLSLINHSCLPNYEVVGTTQQLELLARKDINPGDEITLNSFSAIDVPPNQRFDLLLRQRGFFCECSICSSPNKEQILDHQTNIQRMARDFDFLTCQLQSRSKGYMYFTSTLDSSYRGEKLFGPLPRYLAIDFGDPMTAEAVQALTDFQALMSQSGQRTCDTATMYAAAAELARAIYYRSPTDVNRRQWHALQRLSVVPGGPNYIGQHM